MVVLVMSTRLSATAHTLKKHAPVRHGCTSRTPLDVMEADKRSKAHWIRSRTEQIHTLAQAALQQASSSQAVSTL
jgi:hypothetical protein